MVKIDLQKFTQNERDALVKLAGYANNLEGSMKVSGVPYSRIAQQVNEYETNGLDSNRFLRLQDHHINSMMNIIQDAKVDINESYNQDNKRMSGLADTMVNDPGGMRDRAMKGMDGLMENGIRRT